MTIVIFLGVVAVVIVLVVVTRNSSHVRKAAKADLEREIDELHTPDIMELVQQEASETGVLDIPGADGVDLPVRLRVWHRDGAARAAAPSPEALRFELRADVAPQDATDDDLTLRSTGTEPPASGEPAVHDDADMAEPEAATDAAPAPPDQPGDQTTPS